MKSYNIIISFILTFNPLASLASECTATAIRNTMPVEDDGTPKEYPVEGHSKGWHFVISQYWPKSHTICEHGGYCWLTKDFKLEGDCSDNSVKNSILAQSSQENNIQSEASASENPFRCDIVSRLQSSGTRSGGSYPVFPITCTVVVDSISIKNLQVNRGNCPLITPSTIAMMHLMGESLNPLDALLNQTLKFGYTFEIPGSDECANPIEWVIWTNDGRSYKWQR